MEDAQLLDRLHGLPRERQAARDLWPDIEARLTPRDAVRRPRWRVPAIAAALVTAFLAGVLFERQQPVAPTPQANPSGLVSMQAALQASEREYQAAFRAFVPVGRDPALLDPQAVDDIEASWEQFREAEAALLAALAEHPGNAFLAERLMGLRARQLDFMQQLYMLDQNSRRDT
jgi:hypothetical protein